MPLPKKPQQSVNRQPEGIPVGGQFAATAHSEPDVTLAGEKAFFTEDDNHPDLASTMEAGRDTGDDPTHDFLGAGNGNGGQPPFRTGGSGGSNDDDEEDLEANVKLMSDAVKMHGKKLINAQARTFKISARGNGTIYFDGVFDRNGNSIDDEDGSLAQALTVDVNSRRPGNIGIPASQILGSQKSAWIDAVALFDGEFKVTGIPPLS